MSGKFRELKKVNNIREPENGEGTTREPGKFREPQTVVRRLRSPGKLR